MLRARTSVLVHVLPDDVVQLVAMHAACTAIQRAYRRHAVPRLHFGHVHHKRWDTVRERWRRLDVLTPLYPYPIVRREEGTSSEAGTRSALRRCAAFVRRRVQAVCGERRHRESRASRLDTRDGHHDVTCERSGSKWWGRLYKARQQTEFQVFFFVSTQTQKYHSASLTHNDGYDGG